MFATFFQAAPKTVVAEMTRSERLVLVSRDFDFADIRSYPPEIYHGIVVLELPDDAPAAQINETLERFVRHLDFLERLPGRLAIVSLWRVRFRPT